MSKLRTNCKHCGQLVKVANTRNGRCYKERAKIYKNNEGKLIMIMETYLNCGKYG